jgi:hypothetical protein
MRTQLRQLVEEHGLHAVLRGLAANEEHKKEWLVATGMSRSSLEVRRQDHLGTYIAGLADAISQEAQECAALLARQQQIHGSTIFHAASVFNGIESIEFADRLCR